MTTNRVYRSHDEQEVLKVALVTESAAQEKFSAFRECQKISALYAGLGLMTEVYEVGLSFQGTGYPFLRERYIPGSNMAAAYLENPVYWQERCPGELLRHYRKIQAMDSADVTATWQDKLAGMVCPPGYGEWFEQVQRAGSALMNRHSQGWRIHGDLQFGNLLARRDEPGTVMLIDWEVSEVMPLAYDFAMLYAFLIAPAGQVESPLRSAYAQRAPLREMWARLWPLLISELGITSQDMQDFAVFRMGNGWLSQLAECQNAKRAQDLTRRLHGLLSGEYFALLPLEG